jgi:hypothetical protein
VGIVLQVILGDQARRTRSDREAASPTIGCGSPDLRTRMLQSTLTCLLFVLCLPGFLPTGENCITRNLASLLGCKLRGSDFPAFRSA